MTDPTLGPTIITSPLKVLHTIVGDLLGPPERFHLSGIFLFHEAHTSD